jgi:hypothetical protein
MNDVATFESFEGRLSRARLAAASQHCLNGRSPGDAGRDGDIDDGWRNDGWPSWDNWNNWSNH